MKNLFQQCILAILFISFCQVSKATDDLKILRQRVIDQLMDPSVNDNLVLNLITTIQTDGTWPDINYKDVSRTGFQHGQHLANMVELSRAYKKNGSKLKGTSALKKIIYSALDYWLANDFICENWWWNQIGTPNSLVGTLLIMDDDLTKEQTAKMLTMIGRANLNATGARPSGDRIKIGGIFAKTALFNRDPLLFEETLKVIEGEIKFSTERGMQFDYSFHHREDWVNNTLTYGLGYADAFTEWTAYVAGTRYKFSEKSIQQLVDYYLDGICKMMIYGKYPDPGVMNRDITRSGSQRAFGTTTPERLLKATDYRNYELAEIIKIRRGETKPRLSYSTFFWNSDHFTFQRPEYFTSVRMYSNRINNMEQPYNGEGLMNHHRGDGTNYISRTGEEYFDISPVYDWQKIPGTTVVQKPSMPSENEIQKKGLTDFVGAVTNGLFGAVAFDFRSPHDTLEAKKSWFFFDKEYVCLGAGISSDSNYPVSTTLNQCFLRGDVLVMQGNDKVILKRGENQLKSVRWVFHNGVGYLFPKPMDVNVLNDTTSGSWYTINHQSDSPKDIITKDVFKVWMDHGKKPQNSKYQYIVIPFTTEQEMTSSRNNSLVEILSNTIDIQAVRCLQTELCQIIFYKAGEIKICDELTVGIDIPGIVMIKTEGSKVKEISLADPSHKFSKLHLKVTGSYDKIGNGFVATWNELKKYSEISIDLPQTVFAGKSVTIQL